MTTKKKIQNPEEVLQKASDLLKPWAQTENLPEPNRIDIVIKAENLLPCVKTLMDNNWGYLAAITALDRAEFETVEGSTEKKAIPDKGNIEVLYHFCSGPVVTTLRIALPYNQAKIDTVCGVIPSATFYEREAGELLGIEFVGTPTSEHLLLPDDWPDGVYPLRKTFKGLTKEQKAGKEK